MCCDEALSRPDSRDSQLIYLFAAITADLGFTNMHPPRQTSRSWAAILLLTGSLAGCSSADQSSGDFNYFGSPASTGAETSTGSGDTSGGSEGGSESEGETDEDDTATGGEDPLPNGIVDPPPPASACDPNTAHALVPDLGDANAEAPPVLVAESVLYGDGSVPAIPLSERAFLNRFSFDYPPSEGEELELSGELWQIETAPEDPLRYGLQYAVRAPAWDQIERPALDLAVVIDLGLAMNGEPIELAQAAITALAGALLPNDRVTLIGAGEQALLLASTDDMGLDPLSLAGQVSAQELASFADVSAALELAYDTLDQDLAPDQGQTHVLLISNGHFLHDDALVNLVEDGASEHMLLSSLGVGDPAAYDNAAMQTLADAGGGSTLFSRSSEQLELDLGEQLATHFMSAASELELSLTLPEGLSLRTTSLADAANVPPPRRAQLGPGEALVFHYELESCAPLDPEALVRVEISWIDRLSRDTLDLIWERALAELAPASASAKKGSATVAYTHALLSYRDALEPMDAYGPVLDALGRISAALELLPEDRDLLEMSAVAASLEP